MNIIKLDNDILAKEFDTMLQSLNLNDYQARSIGGAIEILLNKAVIKDEAPLDAPDTNPETTVDAEETK